jgi:hypothetical protein
MMDLFCYLMALGMTVAAVLGDLHLWATLKVKFHKMYIEREEVAIERLRLSCELEHLRRTRKEVNNVRGS